MRVNKDRLWACLVAVLVLATIVKVFIDGIHATMRGF